MTISINTNKVNTHPFIEIPVFVLAPFENWEKAINIAPKVARSTVQPITTFTTDSAKVKTIVQDAVKKYWTLYQQKFPEAFASNKALRTSTPEIVFMNTKADVDKETADTYADQSETNAFTRPEYPNRIYIHVLNMNKKLKVYGDDALRATVAHELMHNLTNAMNKRIGSDAKGTTETFKGVKNQLRDGISLLPDKRDGQILQFSIENLLIEGGADALSIATTGIKSSHVPYQSYRDLSTQLQKMVGKDVYRKAYISNDRVAYKTLIQAAVKLAKGYNEISDKKRILDAVAEFNKTRLVSFKVEKLDPNQKILLVKKYRAETFLKYNLDGYNTQIKRYNFTFLDMITPELQKELMKKKMFLEEATDKDIENAIVAVWKRSHPNK